MLKNFICTSILLLLFSPLAAKGDETVSPFERCGASFFPPFLKSMKDLDFAWVYGTDLLTSKSIGAKNSVRTIYSSSGAIQISETNDSCKPDPRMTKEDVVAAWIQQAKNQNVSPEIWKSIVTACREIRNDKILGALGLPSAPANPTAHDLTK
jgi:hypothetical protein